MYICQTCKNKFMSKQKYYNRVPKFCSRICYYKSNEGVTPKQKSEKWHKAIIKANKEKVWAPEQRERARKQLSQYWGWNKGKKVEDITKHSSWKGGISVNYYKKVVFERDNYTCQICGLHDREVVEVDHIKPRAKNPELKHDLTNLRTLCANCHRRKTNQELKQYGKERGFNGTNPGVWKRPTKAGS